MKIFVDADACPKPIKEILCRCAMRTNVPTLFVANRSIHLPRHPAISAKVVGQGFDVADQYIVDCVTESDIVITADIPLAAAVLEKFALAINPRGDCYTQDNIRQTLSIRNFATELRDTGQITGGPKAFSNREVQAFANAFDREVTKRLRA